MEASAVAPELASSQETEPTAETVGMSRRREDVVGAVSRRAVPQSDSSDDEADDTTETRHLFRPVDFEPSDSSQKSAPSSGQKKRRGSGRPRRRWCAKEFDTQTGQYTCSTDGMYIVKLKVSGLGARPPFVALVHRHAFGGTTYDQVDSETGSAGRMLHMRRGDVLSVRLTAVADATGAELRAIERVGATLSIELCMRKRKRVDEFAEDGDKPVAARALTDPALASQGRASKSSRRRERKRRATGTSVPAAPTTGTLVEGMSACASEPDQSDHTGSDTEWSEGFSSDDEERRKARPPKRMRRLAREIRHVHVTASGVDGGSDGGGDDDDVVNGDVDGDNETRRQPVCPSDDRTVAVGDDDDTVAYAGKPGEDDVKDGDQAPNSTVT